MHCIKPSRDEARQKHQCFRQHGKTADQRDAGDGEMSCLRNRELFRTFKFLASYKTAERYSRESKEPCWHQKSSPSACQQVQQRCQGAPPSFTVTLNPDTSPCLSLQLSSVPKHKLSLLRCRKHERCLTKPTTPHPCEPPRCDPRAWPFPLDHPGQAVIWIFTSICIYLIFLRTAEELVNSRKHRWCL